MRTRAHGMWASVAPRWGEYAGEVDAGGAAVTERMLSMSGVHAGDRVLELACGTGGTGLAAAERVGPSGEVVLSDVVSEMVDLAAARAAGAREQRRVRTATLDLEAIDEPDASYDVVLCREGLNFAFAPDQAIAEIHRVLRPGGRAAVAVWGPRDRNPWLGLLFDAVSAQTGAPVPPPGVPGPFSLDDPARVETLMTSAGFAGVIVEEVPLLLRAPSFEAWWDRTSALAGPLAARIAGLPTPALATLTERLRAAVAPYTTPTGIELPRLALLASGRRSALIGCAQSVVKSAASAQITTR